jgi:hypothetical protein
MLLCYLAHGLGKLKPKIENPGGNTLRRLRLGLGCNRLQQHRMICDIFCLGLQHIIFAHPDTFLFEAFQMNMETYGVTVVVGLMDW